MNLSASPRRAVVQEEMPLRCGGGWQGCGWVLGSVAGAHWQDVTQPSAPLDEP